MIRRILLTCALLGACVACGAYAQSGQDSPDLLAGANALYREGQFELAAERYLEALMTGLDGPRVHYNLANALHRSGEAGAAIAHYQAALTMAPRNEDIRANLSRALAERPAGRPAPPASWLHAVGARIVATFTLSEFAAAAAICWWGALAAYVARLIGAGRRRTVTRVAIVLGVLTLASASFAAARWWAWHEIDRAVVSAESVQLRTGPGESFEAALSVQEGWMLRVLRQDLGWAQVMGEGGATGWVPESSLVMVRPDVAETDS
ncbi:MAG: tetratricopeptide repeat protein [Armatimonadota bacterium]